MDTDTKQISLASIGDCCVDIYPDQHKVFLGGTAFNVAYHAQKAGSKASIVSAVGKDTYGDMFIRTAKANGINTDYLVQLQGKTSSVQIPLDNEGKPIFSGWDLGVLEKFILTKEHERFLQTQNAIRIILLKPLKKLFESFYEILHCVQDDDKRPFTIADFAGGSQYSVAIEEIEKYAKSLDMIVRSVDPNNKKELDFLKYLAKKYKKMVLASLGQKGSIFFTQDKEYFQQVMKTNVTDTTGAGDAYIAHFIVTYLQTKNIQEAMQRATQAASQTITHLGATIRIPL